MLIQDLEVPSVKYKHTYTRKEHRKETFDLREETWIGKNNLGYVIFRHEDVSAFLRDSRWHTAIGLLSELNPNLSPEFKLKRKNGLMALNGAEHARLKKLVMPAFNASHVDSLRPFMKSLMKELLDKNLHKNEIDFQKDIFNYYPIPILCKLFGIPDKDWQLFSDWSNLMLSIFNFNNEISQEKIQKAQRSFDEYTAKLIFDKKQNLSNDLLSALIKAEENGDKLSNQELTMLIEIIIASGIDTTRCQLGLTMNTMLENNLKDSSFCLDEIIRQDFVFRSTVRIASEDIDYKNVIFPKGTLVYLNLVSANFDGKAFLEPYSISCEKNDIKKSLSFGAGLHYCLGAMLAKAEIKEGLDIIFNRIGNNIDNWVANPLPITSLVNGLESLKVTINANISSVS